ncbi:MAG: hypothetical protein DYG91_11425 [Chloroflexi bacterium CFX7]|nr:hypothetical protein [Chloroflexi bacterium CFX7]MCK6564547.1 hypothetical protein [Dehalococcoidia bacterium]MCL4230340.1 hypothetical protein [Dehalococcoidia bacterium]
MIVVGSLITLAVFLLVGWLVSTEMFQQRAWRQRVAEGDVGIIAALLQEALATWQRARPEKGMPANLWAGVQAAQAVAVSGDGVTVSTSAEPEFRTEGGDRVQVTSALDVAIMVAARLADMLLYDVPNLRPGFARVDVFTTFHEGGGSPVQKPILTATADRAIADALAWDALTAAEVLSRFDTIYRRLPSGEGEPIELPPITGTPVSEIPGPGGTAGAN